MHADDENEVSNRQLAAQITTLAAHLNAATCRWLEMIGEFDRRKAWAGEGIKGCAHWLNWKCGIGLVAARERVRVARRLPELPLVREAFAKGELSYSKVRAIARVATPEDESFFLNVAQQGTAAHLEKLVRYQRRMERIEARSEAERQHAEREVHFRWDEDGSLVLTARLPAEQGQHVLNALEAAADDLFGEECAQDRADRQAAGDDSAESPPPPRTGRASRRADALSELAESYLAHGPDERTGGDRYQVVVHVEPESLRDDASDGRREVEEGPAIAQDTARRVACDASVVRMVEGPDGQPLDVGRKTRSIPPAIRRALKGRDGGCRFPGCVSTRHLHGHHVVHWADGGHTRMDNLVLLCGHHHRLVHEGGFDVRATDEGFEFLDPHGQPLEPCPPLPAVRGRADSRLAARNEQLGLTIGPRTAVTDWRGEIMDYHIALGSIAQLRRGGAT